MGASGTRRVGGQTWVHVGACSPVRQSDKAQQWVRALCAWHSHTLMYIQSRVCGMPIPWCVPKAGLSPLGSPGQSPPNIRCILLQVMGDADMMGTLGSDLMHLHTSGLTLHFYILGCLGSAHSMFSGWGPNCLSSQPTPLDNQKHIPSPVRHIFINDTCLAEG